MTTTEGKLKVFLSWSMPLSHDVAKILRDWLPRVVQDVEPWVSSEDIEKGTYWTEGIVQSLDAARVGIIIVTPQNHQRTWLNFEAGALARSIKASGGMVSPLLIDMGTTNIQGPMTTLQITYFNKDDLTKLLVAINERTRTPITADVLLDQIDLLWPRLEKAVTDLIEKHGMPQAPQLNERQILEELLTGVRELRRISNRKDVESPFYSRVMTGGPGLRIARDLVEKHGLDSDQLMVFRDEWGRISAIYFSANVAEDKVDKIRGELKRYDMSLTVLPMDERPSDQALEDTLKSAGMDANRNLGRKAAR